MKCLKFAGEQKIDQSNFENIPHHTNEGLSYFKGGYFSRRLNFADNSFENLRISQEFNFAKESFLKI